MTGQKCSTRRSGGGSAPSLARSASASLGSALLLGLGLSLLLGAPAAAQDKTPDKPKGADAPDKPDTGDDKGDKPGKGEGRDKDKDKDKDKNKPPKGQPKLPGIDIDMKAKALKFRGFTALKQSNQLEVLIATPRGKTHEALLVTDVDPQFIQTALLLIGLKPKPQIKHFGEVKAIKEGDKVVIEVEWKQGAKVERHRVEDLIFDRRRKRAMIRAGFVFTGSRMIEIPKPPKYDTMRKVFAARHRGNIGVMYHDPDAMLDTPLFAGGDDTRFQPYPERLPERMTPVTIHIRRWQESDWKGSPDGDVPIAEGLKPAAGEAAGEESGPGAGDKPAQNKPEKDKPKKDKPKKDSSAQDKTKPDPKSGG